MLLNLTIASMLSRKLVVGLTISSIAVSMFVLFSVDHLKSEIRSNFTRTVSGVDLIVGSRSSQLNLLLYSVFRIGNPSNNLNWQSFQDISEAKEVSWAVPIALGDSHKGFPVIGTTHDYFKHFRYADKMSLVFDKGNGFERLYEVVLGAEVAQRLGYELKDELVISHGTGKHSFTHHDKHPFMVTGILKPSGTPVDQTVFMPFAAIDVIHDGHHSENLLLDDVSLAPDENASVSAFFIGSKNKFGLLRLQRKINQFKPEALTAIVPGVALMELWKIMGRVEVSLLIISSLILFSALLGMTTMLLVAMNERAREIAVLRALGARPRVIILLVQLEAILLTVIGIGAGYLALNLLLLFSQTYLQQEFGLFIGLLSLNLSVGLYATVALACSVILAFIPALMSYRRSLSQGLSAS
jgi:putative ABC transport system permease protein